VDYELGIGPSCRRSPTDLRARSSSKKKERKGEGKHVLRGADFIFTPRRGFSYCDEMGGFI